MALLLVLLVAICAAQAVAQAASGERSFAAPKPSAKDKCPVCGMFVAKYPDWTMVVVFQGGSHVFFDGAKDMFKYLLDLKRYDPLRKAQDVAAVYARDYYHLGTIDARKALYVVGSDVYGPMGRELIPLEKEADAREFLKDHRGKKILRFSEISKEVLHALEEGL